MKKLLLWVITGLIVGAYPVFAKFAKQSESDVSQIVPPSETPTSVPSLTISPTASKSIYTPTPTLPVTNGKYKDGVYTGNSVFVFYGYVQVRVTISNGKITTVDFLQYPNDRGHSILVSNYSMPILKQEAIILQSAKVDIVSGATDTSLGFIQSVDSALKKAI